MATPNYDRIPQEMKACPHWILWKIEQRGDKLTKVPYQTNGRKASSTDPKTWNDFSKIKGAYELGRNLPAKDEIHFDGVGFVFTRESGFSGIDLDHCRDKSGEIDFWAEDYLSKFNSYTEISPSGEGVHIIVEGDIPEGCTGGKKNLVDPEGTPILECMYRPEAAIEIYSEGRFFTVTGDRLDGHPETVEERKDVLRTVYQELFGEKKPKTATTSTSCPNDLSDKALILKATLAKNGDKFKQLWDGVTLGYPSQSEADLALMNELAYWTGKDPARMERLFSESALGKRAKWTDRQEYRDWTIQKAIDGAVGVYEPPSHTDCFENSEADKEQAHKLKALIERIKADPIEAMRDPDVLTEMAEMKKSDPNRFEFFTLVLAKKTRHPAKLFDKMVDAHIEKTNRENPERNPEATAAGREILERGNPIQVHMDHVKERVCGGEKAARVVLLAAYSAFMSNSDRIHADVVGGAQSGKSTVTTEVLDTFPQENVMVTAEASPKSLYYLAQQDPERLKDAIVYIDDARPEHIPVLKTFRNEGNIIPRNLTVADGEVLELVVSYRPVVLASAVTPLRDMEGQATSRAFLVSVPDATPDEEKMVRAKIRQQIATSALFSEKRDSSKEILQEMGRILRDEGIRDVVIPFDVEEPPGADRRGTGQFMRLIKVSAFVNQFQRPVAELEDGRKFVLATYEDFEQAARVWFDFAEGQEFKISSKVIEVLEKLPGDWPGRTATMLAKELEKGQRTIERYLEDLYEAGIASREKISSPGMPWGYWVESELRQKALSQISDLSDCTMIHDRITTENLCRKYMAKFSSDSLKDSSKRFFNNHDIVIKKMYRGERDSTHPVNGSGEDTPTLSPPLISQKSCRDSEKGPNDSEELRQSEMSGLSEMPTNSDSKNVGNTPDFVVIPTLGKIDRETPSREVRK